MSKLNPQITVVEVGIKSLREVTIYPLSLADQTKLARTLATAFQEVMGKLASFGEEDEDSEDAGLEGESLTSMAKQLSNINIMEFIASAVRDNLEIILGLVVDENEKISMEEITNDQFYMLAEVVYVVNYEGASKNFVALVKRAKGLISVEKDPAKIVRRKVSHSKKPSPGSVDGITTD